MKVPIMMSVLSEHDYGGLYVGDSPRWTKHEAEDAFVPASPLLYRLVTPAPEAEAYVEQHREFVTPKYWKAFNAWRATR